jgi:hypothetical protein
MRIERLILIAFLGNYLINNIVAAIVALLPLSGNTTVQYVIYFVLAALSAAAFTWWYMRDLPKGDALKQGAIFGAGAFVVAVITAFVSGISGFWRRQARSHSLSPSFRTSVRSSGTGPPWRFWATGSSRQLYLAGISRCSQEKCQEVSTRLRLLRRHQCS